MNRKTELQRIENEMLRRKMRKMCLEDLYFLVTRVLFRDDKDLYERKLHKPLADSVISKGDRKLFLLPRGHFKTHIVTIGGVIQAILQNPDVRIFIANATLDNAITFLGVIKNQFLHNERLRWLFPDHCPKDVEKQWGTQEQITCPARKKIQKEATVIVKGMGGTLTSQHFDLMVFDDPINEQHVTTPEQINKSEQWYQLSLSLLEPDGRIWVIGTRYHYNDLYEYLIGTKKYEVMTRRALEDGKPIFSKRFKMKKLDDIRKEQGDYHFSCQYMNEPVDPKSAPFKREWIKFCSEDQVPDNAFRMQCIDSAWKRIDMRGKGDYAVIHNIAWDNLENLYVEKTLSSKNWTLLDGVMQSWNCIEDAGTRRCVIEKVGQDNFEAAWFQERQSRHTSCELVYPQRDRAASKEARILALQPYFQKKQVFFVHPKDCKHEKAWYMCPHHANTINELIYWPKSATDDHLDALADAVDPSVKIIPMGASIYSKPYDQNPWWKVRCEDTEQSRITGY